MVIVVVLVGYWWWWWGSCGGGDGESLSKGGSCNSCMSALVMCMLCGEYFGECGDDCGGCGDGAGSGSDDGGEKKEPLKPHLTPLPQTSSQMQPLNKQLNKVL